jgi:hypothetical protein
LELLSRHNGLGGGDLWHLGAALELRRTAVLSFDKDLVKAAVAEGLVAVYGQDLDTDSLIQELRSQHQWMPG